MDYPKRKPIRLPELDYSAGAYFVTICTQDRRCIPSNIVVGDGDLGDPHRMISQIETRVSIWRGEPGKRM